MFNFIAAIVVLIISFIVGEYCPEGKTGGKRVWSPPAVSVKWFDPKTFVTQSEWHIGSGPEPSEITKWEPVVLSKLSSQMQMNDRNGFCLANPHNIMRWQTWESLPVSRETNWMRENRVTIDTLKEGGAFLMTPFLREWQKNNMWKWIPENSRLLDIGIGTGRSRDLWTAKHLRVWGVEPNESSIQQLRDRRLPQIQALEPWGGEDARIQTWIDPASIDVITFVYSITFFSKSPEVFEALLANIRHALAPGGRVVIIGMDGELVNNWFQLKRKNADDDTLDNDLFKITRKYKEKKTFGSEIEITIKNSVTLVEAQTEYLVDFDHMRRAMKTEGFKCELDTHVVPPVYFGEWTQRFVEAQRLLVFTRE